MEEFFDAQFVKENIPQFADSSPERLEEVASYIASEYEKSLERMRRHEEVHRIFEYFGVDELSSVKTVGGNEIVLSEEDLCRIAEGNF